MQAQEQPKSRGPRSTSESDLKKVGVTVVNPNNFALRCDACGSGWSPNFPSHGKRFHRGYWKCPRGCNEPA
jgi:hypothetical protein